MANYIGCSDVVKTTPEQNIASYRRVLCSGDRKQLAEKLSRSAQRKRRMNEFEAQFRTKE